MTDLPTKPQDRKPFPYDQKNPELIKPMQIKLVDNSMAPMIQQGESVRFDSGYLVVPDQIAVIKLNDGRVMVRYWHSRKGGALLRPINPDFETIAVDESEISEAFPVWAIRYD